MPPLRCAGRTLFGLALTVLLLPAVSAAPAAARPATPAAPVNRAPHPPGIGPTGPRGPVHAETVNSTLCRVTPQNNGKVAPLILTVGASFAAGVGAPTPSEGFAVRLAELLGWRSLTLGVPGAGYVARGERGLGPLKNELSRAKLSTLHPALVLIQAGHDDGGVPPRREAAAVAALVGELEATAPAARLVFLTVFSPAHPTERRAHADAVANASILSTIRHTDAGAVVINPITWRFPRIRGGFHPTEAGHLMIAERVAEDLLAAHVVDAVASSPRPASVSCTVLASVRRVLHPLPFAPAGPQGPGLPAGLPRASRGGAG